MTCCCCCCIVVKRPSQRVWSCRDGQLTLPHFSWTCLDLSGKPVLIAHLFVSNRIAQLEPGFSNEGVRLQKAIFHNL